MTHSYHPENKLLLHKSMIRQRRWLFFPLFFKLLIECQESHLQRFGERRLTGFDANNAYIFVLFLSGRCIPGTYHQSHAALSWRSTLRLVGGFDRPSLGSSAAGVWRPEWPRSWPAGGWARRSPPAHIRGSLQTGKDTRKHQWSRKSEIWWSQRPVCTVSAGMFAQLTVTACVFWDNHPKGLLKQGCELQTQWTEVIFVPKQLTTDGVSVFAAVVSVRQSRHPIKSKTMKRFKEMFSFLSPPRALLEAFIVLPCATIWLCRKIIKAFAVDEQR